MAEKLSRPPIAMLFNGVWSQYAVATAPKYRDMVELLYIHDVDETSLDRFGALVVPFQSDHRAIALRRREIYRFLGDGKTVAVFGDASGWIDACWQSRPVNNYWWVDDPTCPPVQGTDFRHPLFHGLTPRQAGWHHHGVYTSIPSQAVVLQRSAAGETVSWQTSEYGGILFASTQDPIVEHGVQQIQHLDHFVDNLVHWLCSTRPAPVRFEIDKLAYGRPWPDGCQQ